MKNSKLRKVLLLACSAVLLVCLSVGATLAYLTSNATVTNTFSVGNVAITMDEADVDDSTVNADRDTANSYKLLPGHKYTKDPTIHVAAGSEDCWLFVKVTNEIAAIEAPSEDTKGGYKTIAEQMAANSWTVIDATNGIYGRNATNKANDSVVVFSQFKVNGTVDNNTLAAYDGKTIVVKAYAVQADGFNTAAEAWDAAPTTWGE